MACIQVLGCSTFRGRGFVISLPARVIRGAELILLLAEDITSAIDPVGSLALRFAGMVTEAFAALFCLGSQSFARLVARARSVQNTGDCA